MNGALKAGGRYSDMMVPVKSKVRICKWASAKIPRTLLTARSRRGTISAAQACLDMHIRVERDGDLTAVRQVNQQAFGASVEADLVDALREQAKPFLSLVAEDDGAIVGHIAFSPVTLASAAGLRLMGLAPMAVLPDRQRRGIGSALVRAGLDACRRLDASAVVVLGHPEYYPRFGFRPAARFDLRSEYDVPDDVFMALELVQGALAGQSGTVRYHPAFAGLG